MNNFYNGLCFCGYENLITVAQNCAKLNYAAKTKRNLPVNAEFYQYIDDNNEPENKKLFLPSLLMEDKTIDNLIDYVYKNDCELIAMAGYDLNEAGIIDARFHLTPIQLLYKLGILDKCQIAGGAALLNEDLDLMAQEKIPLIILPRYNAKSGYGFAPVISALKRNVKLHIGSGGDKIGNMEAEAEFLYLATCADMKNKDILTLKQALEIMKF